MASGVKYQRLITMALVASTATSGPGEDDSVEHQPDEAPWLIAQEKEAWPGLLSLALLLPGLLEAPLQREAGLTLSEYLTLSHVSEALQRRLRMSELAYLANGSLSRLSNVVKRFEQRGWMERWPDSDDGLHTIASLTEAGHDVVVAAAPVHLRAVRSLALDPLNATDQRAVARVASKLRTRPVDLSRRKDGETAGRAAEPE